ncbi:hypothetical protein FB107DRAFT_224421 [Schizophyllum commune]
MTTPGEQQFYAVALMDALVENLPPDWVVGLLYDIACQIHLSAVKHGLFDGYLDRVRFAVAVFHAFGHDWPCQLIYHPRKCIGFGLTDGEGCERFWYSISKLIPYLRVAGYHLRKYTLNSQFAFATKDAIMGQGAWLSRKAIRQQEKRREASILIGEAGRIGEDEAFIREHRVAHLSTEQGKHLGRQEANKALELHEEMVRAGVARDELTAETGARTLEREAAIRSAEATYLAAKARYNRKLMQLGVPARAQLKALVNDKLLHRRANGLVLLGRAQAGIMKRKMEVERVVRSHRNKNGENRLRKHIKTAAERREGTIKSIVSKYNKLCKDLLKLIKQQRTRKGSCPIRPLQPLPKAGLWDLDIDNPCWDDLRFDSADTAAPPWMSDDNVRKAIRARLLLDRCEEEEDRLAHERANVLQWFEEEWLSLRAAIRAAIGAPDAPALVHQLQDRKRAYLRIAVQWERHVPGIRGPSHEEIKAARREWAQASCDDDSAVIPDAVAAEEEEEARTTRSGAAFSNVVVLPDDVDLEQLFEDAERHRAEQADGDSDAASILTTLPSTRSPSPLTELSEDDDGCTRSSSSPSDITGRAPQEGVLLDTPPPADREPNAPLLNHRARKSQQQRKRKRQAHGNDGEASKRHRADIILQAFDERASYDFSKAPVTRTAFTCLRNAWEAGVPELEDLVGYRLLDWDGVCNGAVAVNSEQIVAVMLVGAGKGVNHLEVADAIEKARQKIPFSADEREHRRGLFCVKAIGVSHGGGQKQPGALKHHDKTRKELLRIVKLKPMQRIAHLNSGALQNWQPSPYRLYDDTKSKLIGWKPSLRRFFNFPKSVWACLTINFGPRTVTAPHRDFGNLSHGFCAITALGRFNPDRGGHLIIRELRLVIRFPPGSSVIIPSALFTHHNTNIGPNETRYSVTQYTSGAIFRFVEHGLQLDDDYYGGLDAPGLEAARAANRSRWKKGVAMLSRLPKLRRDAEAVKQGKEVASEP